MTLTDEEIRIKVAEAMGWEVISDTLCNVKPDKNGDPEIEPIAPLPNYPEDLNACHEMEKSLVTVGEWISYMENLASVATTPTNGATAWELVCKMSHSDQKGVLYGLAGFVHATARQRCLAYLKTKGILP